ncbi:hypothetical protein ACIXPF_13135 [Bacteroides fragilis]
MNGFFLLKRPFIWLARFRHRCGYGVHSPFAFDLITNVIYERTPYYAYSSLEAEQKKMSANSGRKWKHESKKVNRLLFRLVNYIQPDTIVDAGTLSASSLYLQAGHAKADYVGASDLSELFLEKDTPVDFLYLHHYRNEEFVEQVFDLCASRTTGRGLFVIEGIRYTKKMKALWKKIQQDDRTGITFDLYDLGIVFFNRTKIKQHYLVNF